MRRRLAETPGFARALRRFLRKHPHATEEVRAALRTLSEDAYASHLGTHKLKGEWAGLWACRAGYDVRIVFDFARIRAEELIVLHNIGTHDEVY